MYIIIKHVVSNKNWHLYSFCVPKTKYGDLLYLLFVWCEKINSFMSILISNNNFELFGCKEKVDFHTGFYEILVSVLFYFFQWKTFACLTDTFFISIVLRLACSIGTVFFKILLFITFNLFVKNILLKRPSRFSINVQCIMYNVQYTTIR